MANKSDRARQFMPFDALKGYKEAIKAKQKIKVSKKELSEDDINELSYKINQIKKGIIIKLVYFDNDEYIEIEGMVSKIDFDNKFVSVVKTKIKFENIIKITSNDISEYEIID